MAGAPRNRLLSFDKYSILGLLFPDSRLPVRKHTQLPRSRLQSIELRTKLLAQGRSLSEPTAKRDCRGTSSRTDGDGAAYHVLCDSGLGYVETQFQQFTVARDAPQNGPQTQDKHCDRRKHRSPTQPPVGVRPLSPRRQLWCVRNRGFRTYREMRSWVTTLELPP